LLKDIDNQIDKSYSSFLMILRKKATIENTVIGYFSYDFGEDIKRGINDYINDKYNSFSLILESLKGETFNNIDIKNFFEWENPDFSKISNIIGNIKISFIQFIEPQKNNEEEKIKKFH